MFLSLLLLFLFSWAGWGRSNGLPQNLKKSVWHHACKVNTDQSGYGWTLLHFACNDSSSSPVISLLLAHPDIDVNVKDDDGTTPFYRACGGNTSCVREMLRDSRVSVNEPSNDGVLLPVATLTPSSGGSPLKGRLPS